MKTPSTLPLLAALALGACGSSEPVSDDVDIPTADCICGTPEAAIQGCPHALCVSGEGNPENPECVCAPLEIGEDG